MNILLIAQCKKSALVETRRVLDQFAERKGHRTWHTLITQQGLNTLQRLLKQTARRNTAVACYQLSRNQSRLLWIVGKRRTFNPSGAVAVHTSQRQISNHSQNHWHHLSWITIAAAIAGLFHDMGKANPLFQAKLIQVPKHTEPLRHEWVSLRLFEAWVNGEQDHQWLQRLTQICSKDEATLLVNLKALLSSENGTLSDPMNSPFASFKQAPFAQWVGWLIVSHHRLPQPLDKETLPTLDLEDCYEWRDYDCNASWNTYSQQIEHASKTTWHKLWQLTNHTPLQSKIWCQKVQVLARHALQLPQLDRVKLDEQLFAAHMARLCVMLADHYYSSLGMDDKARYLNCHCENYSLFANTDRRSGELKQPLDEHLIGVGLQARRIARSLPHLRPNLPALADIRHLKKRSHHPRFRWQNRAFDLARSVRKQTLSQGFFGVNMASTGTGKTLANARIMYGLSDDAVGCRFAIGLGLRTLTLQTGEALGQRLKLQDHEVAILIGSQAVQDLYQNPLDPHSDAEQSPSPTTEAPLPPTPGSESSEMLWDENQAIHYEGSLDSGPLAQWLTNNNQAKKLLSAPILVSTVDHLMPATEGCRGGRQIAPMLRLLTGDLVLDEPDDFDQQDLPALCRLVHWAGLLGSRVLLSSATLPPALVTALFEAYCQGRRQFNQAVGDTSRDHGVVCAWFDEHHCHSEQVPTQQAFGPYHQAFVSQRVTWLQQQPARCRSQLMAVTQAELPTQLLDQIVRLHQHHGQTTPKGSLSIGLLRMANINTLVALAQKLLQAGDHLPQQYRLHLAIYHSQLPLLQRSYREQTLDPLLSRHEEATKPLGTNTAIKQRMAQYPACHHVFLVLASPVAEVGRDHDYDWAIAEPSSMRSLIQLAGRIGRHRPTLPQEHPRLMIWQKNLKALNGQKPAYCRPGFEDNHKRLASHDLADILQPEQYETINAIPRIQPRTRFDPENNLVDLEHYQLNRVLMDASQQKAACHWWQQPVIWSGVMQQLSRFRDSYPQQDYFFHMEDEWDDAVIHRWGRTGSVADNKAFNLLPLTIDADSPIQPWLDQAIKPLLVDYAEQIEKPLGWVSQRYGAFSLPTSKATGQPWQYHPWLGFFR